MSTERRYVVEHTVKMVVTELVTATSAREAIQLARAGHGDPVGSESTDAPSTNWNAHRNDPS